MNNLLKSVCILLLALCSACNIFFAFTLSYVYEAMQTQDMDALMLTIVVLIGIIFTQFLMQIISMKLRMIYIRRKMIDINQRYFASDITSNSEVDMSSYSTKTEMIVQNYLLPQIFIPYYIVEISLTVMAYMWLSPIYVIYMLFVVGIMMVIPMLTQKKSQNLTEEYTNSSKNYINFLNNVFAGKRELNQYNSVETYVSKHDSEVLGLFKNYEKHGIFLKNVAIFSNSIATTTFMGIIIISGALVISGKIELALFMTAIQLMNHFISPIFGLVEDVNKSKSMKKQLPDLKGNISFERESMLVVNDKIELKGVSHSYDDENVIAYPDITFEVNKKYLVTGKSGTGKSTLAKILSGEICEFKGTILADGIERFSDITYVPQTAHLFYGNVLENITLNRDLSQSDVENAMQLANVDTSLVDKLIDVNSEVSGGEKARVSLARSLANMPKIMIIDEPTANLDYKNSIEIIQKLCAVCSLTLIVISHETESEFVNCFDEVIGL